MKTSGFRSDVLRGEARALSSVPHVNEPGPSPDRPDICIGTDALLTADEMLMRLEHALELEGFEAACSTPFEERLVPREVVREFLDRTDAGGLDSRMCGSVVSSAVFETLCAAEEQGRDRFYALARLVTTMGTSRTSNTSS